MHSSNRERGTWGHSFSTYAQRGERGQAKEYFPVSQMFFSLFLYGSIYWIFKNIPLEIVGGGLIWYEYVRTGGGGARSMRTCAYDGGEGVKFLSFWCLRTN